jgi:branched-subunit amino acid aminotransferase/4-amino-4-deoxychorismate lyase
MAQEVLLWNEHGFMTEGSVLTPYFYRNGKWITPAVEDSNIGGQRGTSRRWALERRLAVEGVVEMASIRVGERIWLSNGVRGFGWGRVQATRREETESAHSEW